MFDFGWVPFESCFWRCIWFSLGWLVGFLEKWAKREKSGQLRGSFAAAKRPLVSEKVLAAAKDPSPRQRTPCHGEAEREVGQASSSPRRSHCSQHGNVVFLFRFIFPLFRRLVYWTNKDPISV